LGEAGTAKEAREQGSSSLLTSHSSLLLDEIQFPFQTLGYRAGAAVDIGLLYAGALEAAGIRAGIMPLGDEVIVAFDLGIHVDDAAMAALFNGPNKLLVLGDEVWLPVALSAFDDGFIAAWEIAIARIDRILAGDETEDSAAELVILEEAWGTYPSAPVPAQNITITYGSESDIVTAADGVINRYITSELVPKVTALNAQIRTAPTAALYNQLGTLQLRAGMMAEAKAAFERAAGMGLVGAMVNRGNIALLEKDLTAAEQWFKQALAAQPENVGAARGLEQVEQAR
jgi:tetratricopeptide (TPR) repeat protein